VLEEGRLDPRLEILNEVALEIRSVGLAMRGTCPTVAVMAVTTRHRALEILDGERGEPRLCT